MTLVEEFHTSDSYEQYVTSPYLVLESHRPTRFNSTATLVELNSAVTVCGLWVDVYRIIGLFET